MNSTPRGNRLHIALFGRRNAGKSSLINALTNQQVAIVSEIAGTTTDPVYKSMEILPLGPVVMIDTAGLDDNDGELGQLRIQKSLEVLAKTDLALLVMDAETGGGELEEKINEAEGKYIEPYIYIIASDDYEYGADDGEIIIAGAKVVGVVK